MKNIVLPVQELLSFRSESLSSEAADPRGIAGFASDSSTSYALNFASASFSTLICLSFASRIACSSYLIVNMTSYMISLRREEKEISLAW